MNQPSNPRYAIRLADGQCLGRYSIHGDIVPVPPVFAHTFADLAEAQAHLEHARTAMGFPDAELVPLSECLEELSRLLFQPRRSVTAHCPGLEGVQPSSLPL